LSIPGRPYSPEKEKKFLQEIEKSCILVKLADVEEPDGVKTGVVNIIGAVNTPDRMRELDDCLNAGTLEIVCDGSCDFLIGPGPIHALIQVSDENTDVGDFVRIIPGTDVKPTRYVGVSDAPCYAKIDMKEVFPRQGELFTPPL